MTTREQRLRDWIAQCKAECMAYANTPIGVPVPKKLYLWNRLGDIEAILAEPVEVSEEMVVRASNMFGRCKKRGKSQYESIQEALTAAIKEPGQ